MSEHEVGENGAPPVKVRKMKYTKLNLKNKTIRKNVYKDWDHINKKSNNNDDGNSKVTDEDLIKLLTHIIDGNIYEPASIIDNSEIETRLSASAGSRGFQTVLQKGSEKLRGEVLKILLAEGKKKKLTIFEAISYNKYGHVACIQALRYCEDKVLFKSMLNLIQNQGIKLFCSQYGSKVWEFLVNKLKNEGQMKPPSSDGSKVENVWATNSLGRSSKQLNDFLNYYLVPNDILLTHDSELKTIDLVNESDKYWKTLNESQKASILKFQLKSIYKILKKRNLKSKGIHILLQVFFKHCNDEKRDEVIKAFLSTKENTDISDLTNSLGFLHSYEGVCNLSYMFGHCNNKDKRAFISIMKQNDYLKKMFTNEFDYSWLFLFRILNVMDDTRQTGVILQTCGLNCNHQIRAGHSKFILEDCPLRKCLMGDEDTALGSSSKRGCFVREKGVSIASRALDLSSSNVISNIHKFDVKKIINQVAPTSKKSELARSKELRNSMVDTLLKFFTVHLDENKEEVDDLVIEASLTGHLRDLLGNTIKFATEEESLHDRSMTLLKIVIQHLTSKKYINKIFSRNSSVKAISKLSNTKFEDLIWNEYFKKNLENCTNTDLCFSISDFIKNVDDKEMIEKLKKQKKLSRFSKNEKLGEKLLYKTLLEKKILKIKKK